VSTGLIAGAHMGGGAYLDGCGVTLPPESEDPDGLVSSPRQALSGTVRHRQAQSGTVVAPGVG